MPLIGTAGSKKSSHAKGSGSQTGVKAAPKVPRGGGNSKTGG